MGFLHHLKGAPTMPDNIRKRKDGRWEARYIKADDTGKKYGSVYGKTYQEALF